MKKNIKSGITEYDYNHPIVRAHTRYKCNLEDEMTDKAAFIEAVEWYKEHITNDNHPT